MKYSLRFVWYVLRIVIIAVSAFAILVAAFFIAMDSANVYVVVTDGMKARATAALVKGQSPAPDLTIYFTESLLNKLPAADTAKYESFAITGIDYRLTVESLWCRPWQNTATVTVVESIPEMSYSIATDTQGEEAPVPPQWQRARYKLFCVRRNDVWRIDSIQKIENLQPDPTPTPEPSVYVTASPLPTPSPTATPLPTPTAEATETAAS